MSIAEKLLVVIDPASPPHSSLRRALISASLREQRPELHLFVGNGAGSRKRPGLSARWLEELTQPLRESRLPFDWEFAAMPAEDDSVLDAARRCGASLIINPLSAAALRSHQSIAGARWSLLRSTECPVVLVRPGSGSKRQTLLAAVNYQSVLPEHRDLNRRILARARWLADKYRAQLYVANAYEDMLDYPDVDRLMRESGLPRDKLFIECGAPHTVVTQVARRLRADLVLIGSRDSHDCEGLFRQTTAEKVVARLNVDLMVMNGGAEVAGERALPAP